MSGEKILRGLREALDYEKAQQFVDGVNESRRVLCRRMREHGFQKGEPCDGVTVVCGFCDHTVRQMDEAVVAAFVERAGK